MDTSIRVPETSILAALEEIANGPDDPLRLEELVDGVLWDRALLGPARDILSRPGKGLRGRLVRHAWCLAGGAPDAFPPPLRHAIELLHAGSLVIDDIEDDSHLRRGRPALHRLHGVPTALNTGNWLYFLALALLGRVPVSADRRAAIYEDASAALVRCHQGQALDLSVRVSAVTKDDVPALVSTVTRLKTGSLMRLAAMVGARSAGADADVLEALGRFGETLGVGLQMLDDWSGVALLARREKGIEDVRLERLTWPWAWLAELDDEGAYAEVLRRARGVALDWEAGRVLDRLQMRIGRSAPARVRNQLGTAVDELRGSLGESDELAEIRREIQALERAFTE
jgi:geranylgeranyl pyrophosphate synthase